VSIVTRRYNVNTSNSMATGAVVEGAYREPFAPCRSIRQRAELSYGVDADQLARYRDIGAAASS